ncbi:Endothelin-converting enzyme 2 [Trichoplax sp. H2]|nr:Endothelin-converting enzyme 2 [Trichoplax sp. H2]|eukprot:RDD44024.1 Endothelin-converting enzyme 2 [Trichoplax sp. H2]
MSSKRELGENFEGVQQSKVRVVKGVQDRTLVIFLFVLVLLLAIGLVVAIVVIKGHTRTIYVYNNTATTSNVCTTSSCYATSSEILGTLNTSVNPCENFYEYACGGWLSKNDIPDDRSTYNTFTTVSVKNEKVMRRVFNVNYKNQSGVGEQKAIKYYHSCFNDLYTENRSRIDLMNMIKDLGGWSVVPSIMPVNLNTWQYNPVLAKISAKYDVNPLFNVWVGSDLRDSKKTVITTTQGGLTLPGVRYYTVNETHFAVVAFIEYMTDIAMIMGATNRTATRAKMVDVYRFEKKIARAFVHNLNKRNERADYFKSSISGMKAACPAIDFSLYMNTLFNKTFQNSEPIVNYAMPYFGRMSAIVANTSSETMNNYLIWQFVHTFASAGDSMLQAAYQRYRNALYTASAPAPLWRTCAYRANSALGMAVGAMFVRQAFAGESRITAKKMIEDLRSEFIKSLPTIAWMNDATRKVAADKAKAILELIGYPDFILDKAQLAQFYSNFPVNESYYFINVINRRKYSLATNLAQLGKPFDRSLWSTTPAIVNAFYSSTKNQIVFPAGILQSPFYNKNYPKALNYGAIGSVIGHEITHGFDNNGRRFNKDGELVQWWDNGTIANFNSRAQCFIDQYAKFRYFGLPVNGNQTLGENIADNGGMGQAFRAYQTYVANNGPEPRLPGVPLTNEQLFFVSFARNWCGKDTFRYGLSLLLTDSHSPKIFRVIGTLRNSADFSKAFNCPVGSPMNPAQKCSVW